MASPTPLVSIITPTYNHESFISQCIESVLAQTYTNWEQIIIDDGSTDRTAEFVLKYKDFRIRYYHQKNAGIEALAHTYNRALGFSGGQLIAILEGDDVWPRYKLAEQVPAFQDSKVVLAYGAVADIATDGRWTGRLSRSVRNRMRLPEQILFNRPCGSATEYILKADGVDLVPPSTAVISRNALISIGGFQHVPDLCVTDFPTFARLCLAGEFFYSQCVLGYRRRHTASATYNNFRQILEYARRYVCQFIADHPSILSESQKLAIENTWNRPRPALEFTAGRLKLLSRQWKDARMHFANACRLTEPYIVLASILGWCFSWIHLNLEGLLSLVGAPKIQVPSAQITIPISSTD